MAFSARRKENEVKLEEMDKEDFQISFDSDNSENLRVGAYTEVNGGNSELNDMSRMFGDEEHKGMKTGCIDVESDIEENCGFVVQGVMSDENLEGVRSFFYPMKTTVSKKSVETASKDRKRSVSGQRRLPMNAVKIDSDIKQDNGDLMVIKESSSNYSIDSDEMKMLLENGESFDTKRPTKEKAKLESGNDGSQESDTIFPKMYRKEVAHSRRLIDSLTEELECSKAKVKQLNNELSMFQDRLEVKEQNWSSEKGKLRGRIKSLQDHLSEKQDILKVMEVSLDRERRHAENEKMQHEVCEKKVLRKKEDKLERKFQENAAATDEVQRERTEIAHKRRLTREELLRNEIQQREKNKRIYEKVKNIEKEEGGETRLGGEEMVTKIEAKRVVKEKMGIIGMLASDMEQMKQKYEKNMSKAKHQLQIAKDRIKIDKTQIRTLKEKLEEKEIEAGNAMVSNNTENAEHVDKSRRAGKDELRNDNAHTFMRKESVSGVIKSSKKRVSFDLGMTEVDKATAGAKFKESTGRKEMKVGRGQAVCQRCDKKQKEIEILMADNKLLNVKLPKLMEINANGTNIMDKVLAKQEELMQENVELKKEALKTELGIERKSQLNTNAATQTDMSAVSIDLATTEVQGSSIGTKVNGYTSFQAQNPTISLGDAIFKGTVNKIELAREIYQFENFVHETVRIKREEMQAFANKIKAYENKVEFQRQQKKTEEQYAELQQMRRFTTAFQELLNENKSYAWKFEQMSEMLERYKKNEHKAKTRIERLKKLLEIEKSSNSNVDSKEQLNEAENVGIVSVIEYRRMKRAKEQERAQINRRSKQVVFKEDGREMLPENKGRKECIKKEGQNKGSQQTKTQEEVGSNNREKEAKKCTKMNARPGENTDRTEESKRTDTRPSKWHENRKSEGEGKESIKDDPKTDKSKESSAIKSKKEVKIKGQVQREKEPDIDGADNGDKDKENRSEISSSLHCRDSVTFEIGDKNDDEISLGECSPRTSEKVKPKRWRIPKLFKRKMQSKKEKANKNRSDEGRDDFEGTKSDSQTNLVKIKKEMFGKKKFKKISSDKRKRKKIINEEHKKKEKIKQKKGKEEFLENDNCDEDELNTYGGKKTEDEKEKGKVRFAVTAEKNKQEQKNWENIKQNNEIKEKRQSALPDRYKKQTNKKEVSSSGEMKYENEMTRFESTENSAESSDMGSMEAMITSRTVQKKADEIKQTESYKNDDDSPIYREYENEEELVESSAMSESSDEDDDDDDDDDGERGRNIVDMYSYGFGVTESIGRKQLAKKKKKKKKKGKGKPGIKDIKINWVGFGFLKKKKDKKKKDKSKQKENNKEKNEKKKKEKKIVSHDYFWNDSESSVDEEEIEKEKERRKMRKMAAKEKKLMAKLEKKKEQLEKKKEKEEMKLRKKQGKIEKAKAKSRKKDAKEEKKRAKEEEKLEKEQKKMEARKTELEEEGKLEQKQEQIRLQKMQAKIEKEQEKLQKMDKKRIAKAAKANAKLDKKAAKLEKKKQEKIEKERKKLLKEREKHDNELLESSKSDDSSSKDKKMKKSGKRFSKSKRGFAVKWTGIGKGKKENKESEKEDRNQDSGDSNDGNVKCDQMENGLKKQENATVESRLKTSEGETSIGKVEKIWEFSAEHESLDFDDPFHRETTVYGPVAMQRPIESNVDVLTLFANVAEGTTKNQEEEIIEIDTGEDQFGEATVGPETHPLKKAENSDAQQNTLEEGLEGNNRMCLLVKEYNGQNEGEYGMKTAEKYKKEVQCETKGYKEGLISSEDSDDEPEFFQDENNTENRHAGGNDEESKLDNSKDELQLANEKIKQMQETIRILEIELKRFADIANLNKEIDSQDLEPFIRELETCLGQTSGDFLQARQESLQMGIDLKNANEQCDAAMCEARNMHQAAQVAKRLARVAKTETEAARSEAMVARNDSEAARNEAEIARNEAKAAQVKAENATLEKEELQKKLEESLEELKMIKKGLGNNMQFIDERQLQKDLLRWISHGEPEHANVKVTKVKEYRTEVSIPEREGDDITEGNNDVIMLNDITNAREQFLDTKAEEFQRISSENVRLRSREDSLKAKIQQLKEEVLKTKDNKIDVPKESRKETDYDEVMKLHENELELALNKQQLDAKEKEIEKFKAENGRLMSNEDSLKVRIKELEQAVEEKEEIEMLASLKKPDEDIAMKLHEKEMEIEIKKQLLENKYTDIENMKKENASLRSNEDSLRERIRELEMAISEKEELEILGIPRIAKEANDERKKLQENELEREVNRHLLEEKEEELQKGKEEITKLTENAKSLKDRIQELEEAVFEKEEIELLALPKENDNDIAMKLQESELELEINKQLLDVKDVELQKLKVAVTQLRSSEHSMKERILELEASENTLQMREKEVEILEKEYSDAKLNDGALKDKLKELELREQAIEISEVEIESLKRENSELKAKLTLMKSEEQVFKENLMELEVREQAVEFAEKMKDNLLSENSILKKREMVLKEKLLELEVRLQMEESKELSISVRESEEYKRVFRMELLKRENEELKEKWNNNPSKHDDEDINLLKGENSKLEKEIQHINDAKREELSALKEKLDSSEKMVGNLKREVFELKQKAETRIKQTDETELKNFKQENEKLKNENQVLWGDVNRLESQLESMKIAIEYLQKQQSEQRDRSAQRENVTSAVYWSNEYTAYNQRPELYAEDEMEPELDNEVEAVAFDDEIEACESEDAEDETEREFEDASQVGQSKIEEPKEPVTLVSKSSDENDPYSAKSLLRFGLSSKRSVCEKEAVKELLGTKTCWEPTEEGKTFGYPKERKNMSKDRPKRFTPFMLADSEKTVRYDPAFGHFSPLPSISNKTKDKNLE